MSGNKFKALNISTRSSENLQFLGRFYDPRYWLQHTQSYTVTTGLEQVDCNLAQHKLQNWYNFKLCNLWPVHECDQPVIDHHDGISVPGGKRQIEQLIYWFCTWGQISKLDCSPQPGPEQAGVHIQDWKHKDYFRAQDPSQPKVIAHGDSPVVLLSVSPHLDLSVDLALM